MENINTEVTDTNVDIVDELIASVKKRRIVRPSSENSLEEQAKKREEKLAAKKLKQELRNKKREEKENNKKQTHMLKVEKAAKNLLPLQDVSEQIYNDITTNLNRQEIGILTAHLEHFIRLNSTTSSLGVKLNEGDSVRIINGNPKFIGLTGNVVKCQRIRCYVEVDGMKNALYLFTSDVEVIKENSEETSIPSAVNE